MARAKIIEARPAVGLRLSLPEAAALKAVLLQLPENEDTHLGNVGIQLHGVWNALDDLGPELDDYSTPAAMGVEDSGELFQEEVSDEDVASSAE